MRRSRISVLVATLILLALTGRGPSSAAEATPAATGAERHAILLSIDGLMPAYYLEPERFGLRIPHLRGLMERGAYARGVVGVLPSLTYPSHTTLITGVPPRIHGIVANKILDPEGTSNEALYWYARQIRVPTLVDAAEAWHLTTGAVSWPVSVGLQADFNLPEFWRSGSRHPADLELLRAVSTPHLLTAVENARGRPFPYPLTDEDRLDTAVFLLRNHRPHLLLVHIFELDFAQHDFGPGSPEALAAVEASDRLVGRLLAAVEEAGLAEETLFAVVSDHGFLPVSRALKPNVVLRRAGLLEVDEEGEIESWQAYFHASGGSAALYLRPGADPALADEVAELFRPYVEDPAGGVRAVLGRERIAELGGTAEAALFLDAWEGFRFLGDATGDWSESSRDKGHHGYAPDPDREGLYASFLLTAPELARKGDLGVIPMTRIAPTLARYLGLQLAPEAGEPLELFSREPRKGGDL